MFRQLFVLVIITLIRLGEFRGKDTESISDPLTINQTKNGSEITNSTANQYPMTSSTPPFSSSTTNIPSTQKDNSTNSTNLTTVQNNTNPNPTPFTTSLDPIISNTYTTTITPTTNTTPTTITTTTTTTPTFITITDSPNTNTDTNTDTTKPTKEQVNTLKEHILSSVFHWADSHYPLVRRILTVSRTLSETQIKQIPGSRLFLEMLSNYNVWHKTAKANKYDLTNTTLEAFIDEFNDHHNFSIKDIPTITDLSSKILQLPAVQELGEEAMAMEVNGVPFGMTLTFLLQHVATQIPISQFSNMTVIREMRKNITKELMPFLKLGVNITWKKLYNKTGTLLKNITTFTHGQFRIISNLAKDVGDTVVNNINNITNQLADLTENSNKRTQQLMDKVKDISDDQYKAVKKYIEKTVKLPWKIKKDPRNALARMTDNSISLTIKSMKSVNNLTRAINKMTWANLKDLSRLGKVVGELGAQNARKLGKFHFKANSYAIDTDKNLTNLLNELSPISLKKFKIKDNSPDYMDEYEHEKKKGTLESLPIIGKLPGISLVQKFFNRIDKYFRKSKDD